MRFLRTTYNLEGDDPLALMCYDIISALNMSARQAHYPNLDAIAAHIAAGDAQKRKQTATACKEMCQARPFSTGIHKYENNS